MQLIDPFPGHYDAADPFGNTKPPRTYAHTGSDWIIGAGQHIPAIGSGVVVGKQWHPGNGNTVTVKLDGSALYYAYLHMKEPAIVNVGDRVALGQTLGYVGDTGTNARGPHLHVTVSDLPTAYVGLGRRQDPWALIQANLAHAEPKEESTMSFSIVPESTGPDITIESHVTGLGHRIATPEHVKLLRRYKVNMGDDKMHPEERAICRNYVQLVNPYTAPGGGLSDADRARLVKEINDDAARRLAS